MEHSLSKNHVEQKIVHPVFLVAVKIRYAKIEMKNRFFKTT